MNFSKGLIFLIVFGIFVLTFCCHCITKEEVTEGFATNIADADISAIRNLNGLANELMKPNGTLTNPGNLNVAGRVVSKMGEDWGMLWGHHCAIIGKAGNPIRFGFANDQNANGFVEYAKLDTDSTFKTNYLSVNNNINIGPANKFILQPGSDSWLRLYDNSGTGHGDRGFAAINMWTEKIIGSPNIDNATIAGNLTVGGSTTIKGTVVIEGNLKVTGKIQVVGSQIFMGTGTGSTGLFYRDNTAFYVWQGSNPNFNINGDMSVSQGAVNLYHCGGGGWCPSDIRIKENISHINNSLPLINKLNPVKYDFIDEKYGKMNTLGFIADEVKQVLPVAVNERTDYIPNIYKKIDSFDINNDIITINYVNDLFKIGTKIKVTLNNNMLYGEIYKIDYNTTKIKFDTEITDSDSSIFIFGTQVDDFKSLNTDMILSVSVGAIQELTEKVMNQEKKINRLMQFINSRFPGEL